LSLIAGWGKICALKKPTHQYRVGYFLYFIIFCISLKEAGAVDGTGQISVKRMLRAAQS